MTTLPNGGSFARLAAPFVRSLGLEHYAYMAIRLPEGATCTPEDTLRTSYPSAWASRYVDRAYRLYDPVVAIGSRSRLPFHWGHGGFLRPFTKAQQLIFHEAKEFHITEGYCVPIAGPRGDLGLFAIAAPHRREIDDAVAVAAGDIQLFAVQLCDEIMCGITVTPQSRSELSNRERECLLWTSEGLKTEHIAVRLKLSESAVNYHLGNASRKLGAYNKHHAAIIALREGLL